MTDPSPSRAALLTQHFDLKYPSPEPGELEFLLRRIEDGGEPVLELGCGTGRVLVPLLERRVDVEGVDVSPAMLERCRETCAARGLDAQLHLQPMQALELPRAFGTVFLGSCGLGVLVSDDDVAATLGRVYEHVRPGGVFSCEIESPPEPRAARSRSGVWTGGFHVATGGSVLVNRQVHEYDPRTHVRTGVMIFERYTDGRLEESELHRTSMRFREVEKLTSLLTDAGFVDVIASRVFTDDQPPGDHRWLVVRARKPGAKGRQSP